MKTIPITDELHTKIKVAIASKNITIRDFAAEAIIQRLQNDEVKENGNDTNKM